MSSPKNKFMLYDTPFFLAWVRMKKSRIQLILLVVSVLAITGCQDSKPVSTIQKSNTKLEVAQSQTSPFSLMTNAKYVDDALCADCHSEIFQSYQHVSMAKSFYDFDPNNSIESFEDNHYFHERSGNHYEMNVVDGMFELTRYKQRPDGTRIIEHRQKAQYIVGSGNHVRTYLYRNDNGEMFQLPVVWYSQDKKWGMAPGYDELDHPDFARPITRHCMFCHNAYPTFEEGSDAFGKPHLFPESMPQGIGCQRCHGPGSEHVRISSESSDDSDPLELKAIRGSIVNSSKLPPQLQDDVCNQCHFQPMSQRTSFIRRFGKNDYGFEPGQALNDFMVYFEPDRNNDLADHFEINHHPYRLYQSDCFVKSDGGIRCTHCHNPHSVVPKADRPKHYRTKCFSCHGPEDCLDLEKGRSPQADCVACHMPERRTTDVIHVTMTDHKISRRPKLKNPTAPIEEIDVPIDMPIRQYAFGEKIPEGLKNIYEYFGRVLDKDEAAASLLDQAIKDSEKVHQTPKLLLAQTYLQGQQFEKSAAIFADASDSSSYREINLGISALGIGQIATAIKHLENSTKIAPTSPEAWYNLGVAYSKNGEPKRAIQSLETAVKLRPGYTKARNKLGSVLAIENELALAKAEFEKAIEFDARNSEGYRKLSATLRRLNQWQGAANILDDGLLVLPNNSQIEMDLVLLLVDPDNESRDDQRPLEITKRLLASNPADSDTMVLRSLALLTNGYYEDCLKLIPEIAKQKSRKAEAGLLLAAGQAKLGSMESAQTNYDGASRAFASRTRRDRLASVVKKVVDTVFGNKR